jgi:tetratricopeptide (TPR) repeat protein
MRLMGIAVALLAPASAKAADFTVAPPPAWVQPVNPPSAVRSDGAIDVRLADIQIHFDAAGMHQYIHQIVRVLQPQALQAVGTFGAVWQPATDRITFHRVAIHRGEQNIDVLRDGAPLQIIRREERLEAAMIDGRLTATMPVSDLRVGDEIEYAYTIDSLNPLFGLHRESDQLFARTVQMDRLFVRNSWPSASALRWRIGARLPTPVVSKTVDGQTVLTIDKADFLAPAVPVQSPGRFIDANRLQTSDLADWQSLSALFAPIYETAATLAADSPLKAEIARIAAASSDPKMRAMAALQLVQAQVRYLARMDGLGGYQPANADIVWKERLGDCKGKTVLLLALLHGLGIDAQAAIVSVQQSDGVDISLPAAGRFDHVLVRAAIGGKVYWLDGTRLGDRDLDQIAVPGFQWALPLTRPGSALVRMIATEPALPTEEWTLDLDARDGISLPAKATGIGILRGDGASGFRTSMTFLSEAQRTELLRKLWANRHDWVEIKDVTYSFDEKLGEVRIGFTGTGEMDWNYKGKDASFRYQANKAFLGQLLAPERAAGDPDAPVKVDERYTIAHQTILLPNAGKGFYVDGEAIDRTEGGLHYVRTATVRDGKFEMMASTRSKAGEITLVAAKAADKQANELFNKNLYVRMPFGYVMTAPEAAAQTKIIQAADTPETRRAAAALAMQKCDYAAVLKVADAALAKDARDGVMLAFKGAALIMAGRLDEADGALDAALAADGSNVTAIESKARLLTMRERPEDALILYDRLVLLMPGQGSVYGARAAVRQTLNRNEAALADWMLAIQKDPGNEKSRIAIVQLLVKMERRQDATTQAEAFAKSFPDDEVASALYGNMLAVSGRRDEARAELSRSLAIKPSANAYVTLLSFDLVDDEKTRLAYMLASIADTPDRSLPSRAFASVARDPVAKAALGAAYDHAAKVHPEDKNVDVARTDMELAFGDFALVGVKLDKNIAEAPKNIARLNGACWMRATYRFELEKALANCNAAIAIEENPFVLDSRGLVHLQRGELAAAIADYDAALAKAAKVPTSLYGRGLARRRSGNVKDGDSDLAAARKLDAKIDELFAGYGLKP